MPDLPEFSDKNYTLAGYVVAAIVTLSGGFLIYEVLFNSDLTFKANWNMFKSPLGNLCWMIGFVCAIIFWGKMGHWSRTPVTEYRDSSGRLIKREEDYDVMEQSFAKILMPLIGHFGIEPLVYGALIYYPIQCVIALVGAIFPYVLSLIVLVIIVGAWLFTSKCHFRYHSAVLVLSGVLFTAGFAWGGYALMTAQPGSTIQMLTGSNGSAYTGSSEPATDNDAAATVADGTPDDDVDDQFAGYGQEGLLGSLPEGTTTYEGQMDEFPVTFVITKDGDNITATFVNQKFGTSVALDGESLPAQGGDINFYGTDEAGNGMQFELSGNADNIDGNVYLNQQQLHIQLNKKQ